MSYDVKCPNCGVINRQLNLDETNGLMECIQCGAVVDVVSVDAHLRKGRTIFNLALVPHVWASPLT